ncbi:unnamed protein product, partial [Polarella glacialis]
MPFSSDEGGERQFEELSPLLELLGRSRNLAILASSSFLVAATQLKRALELRGCWVTAAFEGDTPDCVAATSGTDPVASAEAVIILGGSPDDPQAFERPGPLQVAAQTVFAAIADGAPVHAISDESGGCEAVDWLREQLALLPAAEPKAAAGRWATAAEAAQADRVEELRRCLELWPELRASRDEGGRTLLHLAAASGASGAAAALLDCGAALLLLDQQELTAGDAAFEAGQQ